MNKQILSTIIIWLFILPALWWLKTTKIVDSTSFQTINGVISKFECKEINKRFNGKSLIYYNDYKDIITFYDNQLRKDNFEVRCQELSKLISKNKKFTVIKINTFNKVLDLKVGTNNILKLREEVKEFNKENFIFFIISLLIGIVMTVGNFLIWYYKGNPDNWVKSTFFQGVLYSLAIVAIMRYLFNL